MRASDQIAHYAQFLPMVEVNASFYRMFAVKQYAAWDARIAMVMLDEPRADATGLFPSLGDVTEPSLGYFRFQGRDAKGRIPDRERHLLRERHDYTNDEIGSLAERIEQVSERLSGPAVVVFHNNYTSLAMSASQRMIDQLTGRGLPAVLLAIRRRLGELEAPESPG